jgi:hypothetical protein
VSFFRPSPGYYPELGLISGCHSTSAPLISELTALEIMKTAQVHEAEEMVLRTS